MKKEDTINTNDKPSVKDLSIAELIGLSITKNINELHKEAQSTGDRLADTLTNLVGSWTFINTFLVILISWIVLNSYQLLFTPFDRPPFILLNLILSCIAAIQAPIIMMSQNRQEMKDRIKEESNFETNLKVELLVEEIIKRLEIMETAQNDMLNQILNDVKKIE